MAVNRNQSDGVDRFMMRPLFQRFLIYEYVPVALQEQAKVISMEEVNEDEALQLLSKFIDQSESEQGFQQNQLISLVDNVDISFDFDAEQTVRPTTATKVEPPLEDLRLLQQGLEEVVKSGGVQHTQYDADEYLYKYYKQRKTARNKQAKYNARKKLQARALIALEQDNVEDLDKLRGSNFNDNDAAASADDESSSAATSKKKRRKLQKKK